MPTPAVDVPDVLKSYDPEGDALPFKFDSPHSGHVYPDDFAYACPRDKIQWGEDALADKLFDRTPGHDAWFLACQFPRTYIDPNRALVDLDAAMIDGGWLGPVEEMEKTLGGIGLTWKRADDEHEFYDRLLSQAEVRNRIVGKLADYVSAQI